MPRTSRASFRKQHENIGLDRISSWKKTSSGAVNELTPEARRPAEASDEIDDHRGMTRRRGHLVELDPR